MSKSKFTATEQIWDESGEKYFALRMDGQIVGTAVEVDGKYWGCGVEFPAETLEQAASYVIELQMRELYRAVKRYEELERFQKTLDQLK